MRIGDHAKRDMQMQDVVFVGVCESSLVRGDGVLQDLYGVGDLLLLPYFPRKLTGAHLLLALSKETLGKSLRLIAKNSKYPDKKAWHDVDISARPAPAELRVNGFKKQFSATEAASQELLSAPLLTPPDFIYKLVVLPCPPLQVTEPTRVEVVLALDEKELVIGSFDCVFVQTPPISEEERTAIMSRPGALRAFKLGVGCKVCGDEQGYYVLLDPNGTVPDEFRSDASLESAPDQWVCKCGKSTAPLIYAKNGLHYVFRSTGVRKGRDNLEFRPLYQKGALAAILSEYQRVLREQGDSEEQVQKFLEKNSVMWNFLAPLRIWKKPQILTKYNTDFAILSRNRALYLVEIEKPSTPLVKADGGIHHQLQHGIDQIREWKREVDMRREAVLDGFGLSQEDVHVIKYVLVAGMAAKTKLAGLEKIRRMRTDADSIFCFDELASFLHSTETALLNL